MDVEHGVGLFFLGMFLTVGVFWFALTIGAKIMENEKKPKKKNPVHPYGDDFLDD